MALGLASAAMIPPAASGADLSVTVEGIPNARGQIVLGLYDRPEKWPKGPARLTVTVPAKEGRIVYVFKGLRPGRYAITGFDDENEDGKMDFSLIGLPEKGFFFSNDKSPGFSPPSFDDCALTIAQNPVVITVHIQHWPG
jgi:uncharacterized protein (DUF2141 family)